MLRVASQDGVACAALSLDPQNPKQNLAGEIFPACRLVSSQVTLAPYYQIPRPGMYW